MPCSFTHLTLDERRRLMRLRDAKLGVDAIARALGRHRSTICRELKRNWWHDAQVPQAEGDWPTSAQMLAGARRQATTRCRVLLHDRVRPGMAESS